MNHGDTHCSDYKKGVCPLTCYRALLTHELYKMNFQRIVSWAHFKDTEECGKSQTRNRGERFTLARELAGYTQRQAHIKSRLALATIKALEGDIEELLDPKWSTLSALSKTIYASTMVALLSSAIL